MTTDLNEARLEGFSLIDSPDIDSVYVWLHEEEDKDIDERIDHLTQCLTDLARLRIAEQHRYHLTETFVSSLVQIERQLNHKLQRDQSTETNLSQRMITLAARAADVYLQIIQNAVIPAFRIGLLSSGSNIEIVGPYVGHAIHRALELMTYCYYQCQCLGLALKQGFWCKVHGLYRVADEHQQRQFRICTTRLISGGDLTIEQLYARLLLLSHCHLSAFGQIAIRQIYNFCTLASNYLSLSVQPGLNVRYVIEPDHDKNFVLHTKSKSQEGCYYFHFLAVHQLAQSSPLIQQRIARDILIQLAQRFAM